MTTRQTGSSDDDHSELVAIKRELRSIYQLATPTPAAILNSLERLLETPPSAMPRVCPCDPATLGAGSGPSSSANQSA